MGHLLHPQFAGDVGDGLRVSPSPPGEVAGLKEDLDSVLVSWRGLMEPGGSHRWEASETGTGPRRTAGRSSGSLLLWGRFKTRGKGDIVSPQSLYFIVYFHPVTVRVKGRQTDRPVTVFILLIYLLALTELFAFGTRRKRSSASRWRVQHFGLRASLCLRNDRFG